MVRIRRWHRRNARRESVGAVLLAGTLALVASGVPIWSGESRDVTFALRTASAPAETLVTSASPRDAGASEAGSRETMPAAEQATEPVVPPAGLITGSHAPLESWQAAAAVPQPDPAAAAPEPVADWTAARAEDLKVEPAETRTASPPPLRTIVRARPASTFSSLFLGKWVPNRDACTDAEASDFLPLRISHAEAKAGEGTCTFVSKRQVASGWSVVAQCSDGREAWTSNVNLAVAGGRLTWTSERGTQSYDRCETTRIAKVARKERLAAAHRPAVRTARTAARKMASVRVLGGDGTSRRWAVLRAR